MWNCGSARVALIVVIGTAVCTGVSPDCWLAISALAGTCLAVLAACSGPRRAIGGLVGLKDAVLIVFFTSGIALLASLRMEGYAGESHIITERVACVRGTVSGFAQPSESGTSVTLSTLRPDSLCAPLPKGTRVLVKLERRTAFAVSPGDTMAVAGLLRSPLGARNPGGFSEATYLSLSKIAVVLTVPAFLKPVVRRADPPRGFVATYMVPLHGWIEKAINRHVGGEERAFLLALVLGERGELTDEMKDAFRRSGIIHLISVSGLHTGLVGMIAFFFLRGVRAPVKTSLVGSVLIVWFYCGISGCSPPTLRCSVMVTCVAGSRLLGRGSGLVSPLCASCAILLLVNPGYMRDVGFQLSYAATGSMMAGATLSKAVRRRLCAPEWVSKYVFSTILTTIVAQLGVLPILACQFGSVSAVSIPANLLAIPVASGALVSSFCALGFLATAPPLASASFSLTWFLLRLCNLIARFASSVPGASIELVKPTGLETVMFMVCLFVFLRKTDFRRSPRQGSEDVKAWTGRGDRLLLVVSGLGMVVCGILLAGVWIPGTGRGDKSTDVYFLDVGQGDATAVRLPDGRLILIDGGESQEKWDSAKRVLVPFLREARKKAFDMVLVTHFHSDHVGGVMKLLEEGRVGKLIVGGADTTTALSRLTRLEALRRGTDVTFAHAREKIVSSDGVELIVLHPSGSSSTDTSFASLNDSSMVLVLRAKTVQFILTGDAGPQTMDRVADSIEPGKLTVLKAPHHGGKGTLSVHLLERIRPRYVVFSVGHNNRFGHPAKEIVKAYEQGGAKIMRTDADGCVSFHVLGDSLDVRTAQPASGLPFIQKAKRQRGERRAILFALFSGTAGVSELSRPELLHRLEPVL